MDHRPDPDQLLKEIQADEKVEIKGRLKIFFGYAAGVGKTYAMLDAAQTDIKNNIDVVAGYVEPHKRPDTIALLSGLEVLSPLMLEYKGIRLKEFDLDAALYRKPQLILVDELAHTNAEGCRHAKRYQDIQELLEAGIDVYTTVNVQHLESLNDIVASITHVTVHERIPDSVFDQADQVELVDIEPEQLIRRLEAGKIYQNDQAKRAMGHFFLKENLTALREIALRRTADRVNRKVMEERSVKEGKDYYTGEHILICISESPTNAKVIRTAARMANAFQAELIALYVETPAFENADRKVKQAVYDNMKLAKQFGAKTSVIFGDQVAYQIAEYAKSNGISKIVIGRTGSRTRKYMFFRPNLIEKLTAMAPNLDIYVIPDQKAAVQKKGFRKKISFSWTDLGKMLAVLSMCTIGGGVIDAWGLGNISIAILYIVGTVLISWITKGRACAYASAGIGVILYNLLFTEPKFTLDAYNPIYPFTFAVMLGAALITSSLTLKLKIQGHQEFLKSRRTEILLNTSHKLRRALGADQILTEGGQQVSDLLERPVAVYNTVEGKLKEPVILFPHNEMISEKEESQKDLLTEDERGVAAWVLKTRHRAGRMTDTLPGAKGYYIPVSGEKQVFAVYGIALDEGEEITPFDKNLLKAMINETAFAAEKYVLLNEQKKLMIDAEKDKLRANLLRAVSHDLRTPLSGITGYSSILLEDGGSMDDETRHEIYLNLYDESMWLNHLVENILTVTKLDAEGEEVKNENQYLCDIIQDALKQVNSYKKHNKIKVELPEVFVVKGDAHLISRVVLNMVDNSIRYTQPDSTIVISAREEDGKIAVEVADNGPGITDAEKEKIFDLYFKAANNTGDNRRGLGLGLSLCKTIIQALDGEIYVKDRYPKGTVFGFTLQKGSI